MLPHTVTVLPISDKPLCIVLDDCDQLIKASQEFAGLIALYELLHLDDVRLDVTEPDAILSGSPCLAALLRWLAHIEPNLVLADFEHPGTLQLLISFGYLSCKILRTSPQRQRLMEFLSLNVPQPTDGDAGGVYTGQCVR